MSDGATVHSVVGVPIRAVKNSFVGVAAILVDLARDLEPAYSGGVTDEKPRSLLWSGRTAKVGCRVAGGDREPVGLGSGCKRRYHRSADNRSGQQWRRNGNGRPASPAVAAPAGRRRDLGQSSPVQIHSSGGTLLGTLDSLDVTLGPDPSVYLKFDALAGAGDTVFTFTSAWLPLRQSRTRRPMRPLVSRSPTSPISPATVQR